MKVIQIIVLFILLTFASCLKDSDSDQCSSKVQLNIDGVITVKAEVVSGVIVSREVLTVREMRIIVFNKNGNCVSNTLLGPEYISSEVIKDNITILSVNENAPKISTSLGEHTVYVVINESAAGISTALQEVSSTETMEQIRNGRVEYTNLIAVKPNEEPPFVMCVHDKVNITSASTSLNLTGIVERGVPTYGFPMRRSMAKVILESIVGGVTPDGYVLGLNEKWNGNAAEDQKHDDFNNTDLIATSQVHILGVDLINVPTHISWAQNGSDVISAPEYTGTYRTDPIPIATSDFHLINRYFDRVWPGHLTGTGEVEFTRTDAMYSMWKVESSSGKNAYAVYDPADVEANPDNYFNWGISGGSVPVPAGITKTITYEDAMKTATNFSHYTIDEQGIIHLYNTSGQEFSAPNNSLYTLNKGNFTKFFENNYGNTSGNFVPGRPIAGEMKTTPIIDPAVWQLKFDGVSYYIPENITSDPAKTTKIRITASLAMPTVVLDTEEVNKAINTQGGTGTLVGEDGMIDMSDNNIINYLYAKGQMMPHPTKEGYYAMVYAGLSRMYKGTVTVSNADGRYERIVGTSAMVVTIDVPLNNDEVDGSVADTNTDHNIYRGHEYRVRLYITRKGSSWSNVTIADDGQTTRSVSYYPLPQQLTRGSDDLYLAVEVIK